MNIVYEQRDGKLFPGFYDSWINPAEVIEDLNTGREPEDVPVAELDPEEWLDCCKRIAACAVDELQCIADENFPGIVSNMTLEKLWMPREYTFYTDMLEIRLDLDEPKLRERIEADKKAFQEYLWEHWRSRSGFVSLIPTNYYLFMGSKGYPSIALDYLFQKPEWFNEENYLESLIEHATTVVYKH